MAKNIGNTRKGAIKDRKQYYNERTKNMLNLIQKLEKYFLVHQQNIKVYL